MLILGRQQPWSCKSYKQNKHQQFELLNVYVRRNGPIVGRFEQHLDTNQNGMNTTRRHVLGNEIRMTKSVLAGREQFVNGMV